MARMKVACLMLDGRARYRKIATAMAQGIAHYGDEAVLRQAREPALAGADCALMYGWARKDVLRRYRQFVYFDIGYWERDSYYRFGVNRWSSHGIVGGGGSPERLNSLGIKILPWRTTGDEIIVAGQSAKAATEHGFRYGEWERLMVERLAGCGKRIVYRPKPNDLRAQPIAGTVFDRRPLGEALASAWAVATHHSNVAIDALVAGVPVYCELGAGAAFSVPFEALADPPLRPGREQFLADTAYLQWTLDEMRSGECWAYMRGRGLVS